MLIVIHLTQTDGDIELSCCNDKAHVEEYLREHPMNSEDYAVIEGAILKDFFNVTW
jgi:hypothetical protein